MKRHSARQRGYSWDWEKARAAYLLLHPLCVKCEVRGLLVRAAVVDHIVPHRGDARLFWDETNWQALCRPCHDSVKQREEKSGPIGVDAMGRPIDIHHPWNA